MRFLTWFRRDHDPCHWVEISAKRTSLYIRVKWQQACSPPDGNWSLAPFNIRLPSFAHDGRWSADTLTQRLIRLMESYYEESSRKIEALHYIRFTFENTAYYEMGYVMGEIIERYRKMVEHIKRPIMFKADAIMETLLRIEFVQKLYFEVYHLVQMMHEIPRKHGYSDDMDTKTEPPVYNNETAINAREEIFKNREIRSEEKRKKLKVMKKLRDLILKGQAFSTSTIKKPPNKWWPFDYGWEIDYYWP